MTRTPAATPPELEADAVAVRVEGDGAHVTLENRDGSHPVPGSVPPGAYDIRARFGSAEPMTCGSVVLVAGASVTLYTDSAFTSCERR